MGTHLTFRRPADIPRILDLIHDEWLDGDGIRFSRQRAELSIPFRRRAGPPDAGSATRSQTGRKRGPRAEWRLIIHHVIAYRIRDFARVRFYDFDRIAYDPGTGRILITTGVPIEIEATVDRFRISVEETGRLIDESLNHP